MRRPARRFRFAAAPVAAVLASACLGPLAPDDPVGGAPMGAALSSDANVSGLGWLPGGSEYLAWRPTIDGPRVVAIAVASGAERPVRPLPRGDTPAAFAGTTVFVSGFLGSGINTLSAFDIAGGAADTLALDMSSGRIAASEDGRYVAYSVRTPGNSQAPGKDSVVLVDRVTRERLAADLGTSALVVQVLGISPDASEVAVLRSTSGTAYVPQIALVNVATQVVTPLWSAGGASDLLPLFAVSWASGAPRALVFGLSLQVAEPGTPLRTLTAVGDGVVEPLAWSADGAHVIAAESEWQGTAPNERLDVTVVRLRVSDGQRQVLATGTRTTAQLPSLSRIGTAERGSALSQDGQRMVVASPFGLRLLPVP